MALDGITIAALTDQFRRDLADAYVERIIQPESELIQISFKTATGVKRLALSANASLPYLYEISDNMTAPLKAPSFCMLLRKYIGKGRLLSVEQPSMERIIRFTFSHMTELKDQDTVILVAEMMGKHSNLILISSGGTILGAIRPVSGNVSSLREVLPGRDYYLPESLIKHDPLSEDFSSFRARVSSYPGSVHQALLGLYAGISPSSAYDICYRSRINEKQSASELDDMQIQALFNAFSSVMDCVRTGRFEPCICYENDRPKDCCAIIPATYPDHHIRRFPDISLALEQYYSERSAQTFIRQKSSDLRQIITTHLDRANRKYNIQKRQLKDTDKKDTYRLYGEMIQSYAYAVKPDDTILEAESFEDGKKLKISLDPTMTPQQNAQRYFAKYAKMKRTYDALIDLIDDTAQEVHYLDSALCSLSMAANDADLDALRDELAHAGYIKKRHNKKKKHMASKPMHYLSSDGYDIFIGKNNIQNDELTFKLAGNKDLWFHAKQMPGSHVIVLTRGEDDLPDRLYEEAAAAAAYYSRGSSSEKVDVDYVRRKEVKKPAGAHPGYVIYHTNYSITVKPSLEGLKEL